MKGKILMRKIWGAAGLAALALTVSACASSSSSPAAAGNTPAAAASSSPAASAASGGTTLEAKTIGGQQVVTNAQGEPVQGEALGVGHYLLAADGLGL